MLFYIDSDLRTSRIFIAPYKQIKGDPYVIECNSNWEANNFLKKLNARTIKGPIEDVDSYHLKEIMKDPLGNLRVYIYIK